MKYSIGLESLSNSNSFKAQPGHRFFTKLSVYLNGITEKEFEDTASYSKSPYLPVFVLNPDDANLLIYVLDSSNYSPMIITEIAKMAVQKNKVCIVKVNLHCDSLVFNTQQDADGYFTTLLEDTHHHLRYECICGKGVTTCRCTEPKLTVKIKSCYACNEAEKLDNIDVSNELTKFVSSLEPFKDDINLRGLIEFLKFIKGYGSFVSFYDDIKFVVESLQLYDIRTEQRRCFELRTRAHIRLVQDYADKLILAFPGEFDGLKEQTLLHDSLKFEYPDYHPYVLDSMYHQRKREQSTQHPLANVMDDDPLPESSKKKIQTTVIHHVLNSPHHPEYWLADKNTYRQQIENNEDKSTFALDVSNMPPNQIAEMVCDWMAMGSEFGNTAKDWFDKNNGKRWLFSVEQQQLINRLLEVEK